VSADGREIVRPGYSTGLVFGASGLGKTEQKPEEGSSSTERRVTWEVNTTGNSTCSMMVSSWTDQNSAHAGKKVASKGT
jgi:hypothetical protein